MGMCSMCMCDVTIQVKEKSHKACNWKLLKNLLNFLFIKIYAKLHITTFGQSSI